ncbi:hypothetical protein GGX14DRAFT_486129, partial [Mycena pura]
MALRPLEYALSETPTVAWTTAQEKSLSQEYPLNTKNESCDDYLARTYFQFLWLPESIMPLGLLVPSLLRMHPGTESDGAPHPLHAKLERLLLTTRAVTNKYHVELPYILANGGGEGEEEETMMWFAVSHEKNETDADAWLDDAWRTKWMERMERREVQVQILLHMLKLSLPGPPPPPEHASPRKKRRKLGELPPASIEDRLEAFMDKLSTWQLLNTLDTGLRHRASASDDRDWMQAFCADIVEPRFGATLSEHVALLRDKVFPHSPFSDTDDADDWDPPDVPAKRARSTAAASGPRTALDAGVSAGTLSRTRSRSLSVTLAEERERERQRE